MSRGERRVRRRGLPLAADLELERVLRLEVAFLLEEAARLRARSAPFASLLPEVDPCLPSPERWRGDARDALRRIPRARLVALFALCAAEESVARWPRASRIARAAVALAPGARARLALAEAYLAEGDGPAARALFAALLRDEEPAPAGRVWTGLGAAHESEGNDRLALAAYDRAGAEPDAGAEPLVGGLFLALALGDVARARRAGARLLRLAARDAAAVDASIRRRARRVELLRARAEPAPATAALARSLARAGRASGRVARLVLGEDA